MLGAAAPWRLMSLHPPNYLIDLLIAPYALRRGERGTNLLDSGAPFYDTYETQDGK